MYFGIAILRVPNGLNYSQYIEEDDLHLMNNGTDVPTPTTNENDEITRNQSASQLSQGKNDKLKD